MKTRPMQMTLVEAVIGAFSLEPSRLRESGLPATEAPSGWPIAHSSDLRASASAWSPPARKASRPAGAMTPATPNGSTTPCPSSRAAQHRFRS